MADQPALIKILAATRFEPSRATSPSYTDLVPTPHQDSQMSRKTAAELAIRHKTECITLDLLEQAASAGIFRIPVEEETDDSLA
jgi:hypothetical protein